MWQVYGALAAVFLLGLALVFNHWWLRPRRPQCPRLRERRANEPLGKRIEEARREWGGS
jgi:hypothetical protein